MERQGIVTQMMVDLGAEHGEENAVRIPSRDLALRGAAGQRCKIMFGRLKDWRGLPTRYNSCPKDFRPAISFAARVIYWISALTLVSVGCADNAALGACPKAHFSC